ncbi:uncharacterized protein B0P05DRAFT_539350 [Gilbertella persicaria]|uniref:uncharacterized protein n=1 Tax=Gilbertella persicaria TaxID=101096 RepID=UPI00221E675F|nr:uncharacterized protein B0P05DRAFT_539350 [Gilbertella persicaria]KAI8080725.1 hypothetical protein B0P05DRAFT_539350 [Gilbertella persicaria]
MFELWLKSVLIYSGFYSRYINIFKAKPERESIEISGPVLLFSFFFPMLQKKRIAVLCLAATLLLYVLYLFINHRHVIIELVQTTAIELRTQPYSSILLSCLIIVTSIPPMIGFTFMTTLTGFIYGFPGGILPAVCGAFMGANIAFGLIRTFEFSRWVRLSPSKQEKYVAIQEAIEQGGFKMMMLIRLSPIPWPITNMLLSVLPTITTQQFVLSSALSSIKVSLEVWIGSQLADLSNPHLPPSAHRITMLTMGCSLTMLVGVAWWLYRLTMQKVDALRSIQTEPVLSMVTIDQPKKEI